MLIGLQESIPSKLLDFKLVYRCTRVQECDATVLHSSTEAGHKK